MPHLDPDVVALLALGEPVASEPELRHLRSCEHCTAELDELTGAVQVGREAFSVGSLLAPPPAVWDAISKELGLAGSIQPASASSVAPVVAQPLATVPHEVSPPRQETAPAAGRHAASRQGRRITRVVVSVAGIAAVALLSITLWRTTVPDQPEILATAQLAAFPDWPDASGDAVAEILPDGARELRVRLSAPTDADASHEVWLISSDATRLVSLGVLQGETGSFTIPAGIDISDYDLVDVSAEPHDGNTAHSGNSIVRGPLA